MKKDAKFDRLCIKGFINGKKYKIILDSIESVQKVMTEHENNYINVLKYSNTLVYEILWNLLKWLK